MPTKTELRFLRSTMHLEISAVVPATAKSTFTIEGITVEKGSHYFYVRSSKDPARFYVVSWQSDRWTCSCGAGSRPHAHTNGVKGWLLTHRVHPEQSQRPATLAVQIDLDVEMTQTAVSPEQIPTSDQPVDLSAKGCLNGSRSFSILRKAQ